MAASFIVVYYFCIFFPFGSLSSLVACWLLLD
jgi:hypothetical protein